ncbi:MAG TPA: aminotransferase class I/II-fold pyridoxal phosphate-dependent enzyme [Lacisediminihabitans sp.]|nr:aminotransferase class I/II-fold pyridoxal phosphate-dependent enzyme [Lacisediminihabitans sp.]HXD61504.1 aminotransferase class I/II-fold pyridoxal phosphate-dependent enzyme [Lacisediminihabitans sp.]
MKPVAPEVEEATPHGIATTIARMISTGDLAPGDRLPTVRELAADLGISPATVSHAWQALSEVGLIISRGRSGSFVRATPRRWLPPRFQGLAGQLEATRLDLSTGTPDPQLLPALGPALGRVSMRAATTSYLDQPVIPELETALRDRWPYEVEAVTVVDGAMDGISRALDMVVRFGDRVVVENPGFPPIFDLLDHVGAVRVPVDLDEDGMRPGALAEALRLRPRAIVLQPRAQNPTGRSLSRTRAQELARVIRNSRISGELIIVEDDHSGEISANREVSLGSWLPDQVLHIRSFSKSHGPDLRIAAVGGPTELIDQLVSRRILGPGWTSRMLQTILLDLLTTSKSISEVSDARRVYRARQRRLSDALAAHGVHVPVADGINTWLEVSDERSAVVQLAAAGIRVAAGTPFLATGGGNFIRVTAGFVRAEFDAVAAQLAAAVRA